MSLISAARWRRAGSWVLCAATALLLAACGAGDDDTHTGEGPVGAARISGADGASVSFTVPEVLHAQAVTVRVARDGSGAPALPAHLAAAGAVYQYTPFGLHVPGTELRVPFDAQAVPAGARPRLLVAQPGGEWVEVVEARAEAGMLVARVAQLAYATVAVGGADEAALGANPRDRIQSARPGASEQAAAVAAAPVLSVSFNSAASTPVLPAPESFGVVRLTRPTQLMLRVTHALPASCGATGYLALVGANVAAIGQAYFPPRVVVLTQRPLASPTGTIELPQPISSSDNGYWLYQAVAFCGNDTTKVYGALGPLLLAKLPVAAAPTITQAPTDLQVVEGSTASFSVLAQGTALGYQWQRSNDGGASWAPVAGATAASVSLTATLADQGSLWRVVVTSGTASTTSTAARLQVAARVVAPAVTADPASRTVVEGQTASFTVAGSGTPAPTVQWQARAQAVADAEAGWSDIAGATDGTFTTPATTVADSGRQFRALLSNGGGTARSLPATLTVTARIVAPAVTGQPASAEVFAGEFGVFRVVASGSSPLSYQWFKDDQPIVGENGSELRLFADPADTGRSFQLRVRVSNSAGSEDSAVATFTVQVPGTRIVAADGGTVEGANGASLDVPPDALAGDATIAVVSEALAPGSLPDGVVALSDVIDVKPAGVRFVNPVALNLSVLQDIPAGTALAFIDPTDGSVVQGLRRQPGATVAADASRSERVASSRTLARARITAFTLPAVLNCRSPQFVDSGGIFKLSSITSAIRGVLVAVPESLCSTILPPPAAAADGLPFDTIEACDRDEQFGGVGAKVPPNLVDDESSLLNRHVNCRQSESTIETIVDADMLEDANGEFTRIAQGLPPPGVRISNEQVVTVRLAFQVATYGPSNRLGKRFRYRARIVQYVVDPRYRGPDRRPAIHVRPDLGNGNCYSVGYNGFPEVRSFTCRLAANKELVLGPGTSTTWSPWAETSLVFDWAKPADSPYDMAFFLANLSNFQVRIAGTPADYVRPQTQIIQVVSTDLGYLPTIRCDKGIALSTSNGCVFPQAAPVYVLERSDWKLKEAAEHILEAQEGPQKAPAGFVLKPGTRAIAPDDANAMQRAKLDIVKDANRARSCQASDSLYNTRLPLFQSASCAAGRQPCSCDEYPFASTWSGGAFYPNSTSAKLINASHNNAAGGGKLAGFYSVQRVLDLSLYDESVRPFDISAVLSRAGDNFWVAVK